LSKKTFYIVDVFAEKKYSGNQLAVFRRAADLSATEMQAIAREMNFSETTFILADEPRAGGYDVRIFTPGGEVPFAGHPTLGTAYIIQREIVGVPVEELVLNLQVGSIPVRFGEEGILWMKQNVPEFGPVLDVAQLAGVLGLEEGDFDSRFPIQQVSTGLPHVIVPLMGLAALRKIKVAVDRYYALIEDAWAKAILVFCPDGYDERHDLGVRMFADYYGVPEDPATGSGNGCLAGYLVQHRYFGRDNIDIRTGQGFEIGRPSLLYLRAARKEDGIAVSVGGRVMQVAEGSWMANARALE
jgi:trans-2,3-dihydro-3-hydroxyanthranilate isomerase